MDIIQILHENNVEFESLGDAKTHKYLKNANSLCQSNSEEEIHLIQPFQALLNINLDPVNTNKLDFLYKNISALNIDVRFTESDTVRVYLC